MIDIREEQPDDVFAREALLDTCFGPSRFSKTCERLREGRLPATGLALSAVENGRLVGTVRLWHVSAGLSCPALMLGPLAVNPEIQSCGLGGRLMRDALLRAAALHHQAVLLVGDAPYYARFGFSTAHTDDLWLPGPYERQRFLSLELVPGALAGVKGLVSATGQLMPVPEATAQAA